MEVNFIGGTCIDEFYKLIGESFPIEGQKVLVEYEATKCGGMVSNAASVMSMLGMKSNIIDVLNKNEESSKTILKDLKEYNINTDLIQYTDKANNKCIIVKKDNGERVIFVYYPDSNDKIILNKEIEEIMIRESSFNYSEINEIKTVKGGIEYLFELVNRGAKFFIDFDFNVNKENIEYVKLSKIISMNEFGKENLLKNNFSIEYLFSISKYLEYVIVTLGANGAEVFSKDGNRYYHKAYPLNKVDTTGAGDHFNSAFLYAIINNYNIDDALKLASAAGSYAVTFSGAKQRFTINILYDIIEKYVNF
ncbi:carbohydrate kinase family protein [Brachyspira pilosicoli]|uniref:carbohydrate kinase family protein n=1 Tax=Brachyspira pilosicoli TaxID=52584 RepID=UPI0030077682